ncbi:galactokinase [Pelolinea submarina]|uniref:Galactokinase n=1 Tax=Pelolinea submarina TaxID=913107 RepID=A0A347ZQB3_9CHLR|nr:galactokinase [Pelolinea submarina]REG06176.1 galactokinase [Pelolinea submarina]BBB47494.1 galactokinase [Pelolinea submarina]
MKPDIEKFPDWEIQVISPGRVNLLGEQAETNQSVMLPIAIDRAVRLAARPRTDRTVTVESLSLGERVSFQLDNLQARMDSNGQPLPAWALYPAGVAWALSEAGLAVGGLEAVIESDLPVGAGLGSSSALELAFALAWSKAGEWQVERAQLARICQMAEIQYAGKSCDLMDQFTCAHGVARHALLFDMRSLQWQPLPMPPNTVVILADSGAQRDPTHSEFNRRRAACEQAVQALREDFADIHALRDVSLAQLETFTDRMPAEMYQRAHHVLTEMERVRQAAMCLLQDDAAGFGRLMNASHASLREEFEVSTVELDWLAERAQAMSGCYGARLTGPGFGGCTVNLVAADQSEDFMQALRKGFEAQFGRELPLYACQAGRGAHYKGA